MFEVEKRAKMANFDREMVAKSPKTAFYKKMAYFYYGHSTYVPDSRKNPPNELRDPAANNEQKDGPTDGRPDGRKTTTIGKSELKLWLPKTTLLTPPPPEFHILFCMRYQTKSCITHPPPLLSLLPRAI